MLAIRDFVGTLRFGELVVHENLAMLPIVESDGYSGESMYLMLEDAVARKLARIQELENASVPEIVFENMSDRAVLMLAGEELTGARQNRILNVTILAPPMAKIVIPVSCVEAGRWRPVSSEFRPAEAVAFPALRARSVASVSRSLRVAARARADQAMVWNEVDRKLFSLGLRSPTSAMRTAYESHEEQLERYVRALRWKEGQVGVVFAIDGRPAGLDLFDQAMTCQRMMAKIVRGYALDAVEGRVLRGRKGEEGTEPGDKGDDVGQTLAERLRAWVASIGEAETFSRPSAGMGEDVRIEGAAIAGAALWALERYVHLCAFPTEGEAGSEPRNLDREAPRSVRLKGSRGWRM